MKVHARLIRTMDGKEIYSREFQYKSPKHNSADWLDVDAHLLREEIDNCFKELPRQIIEELFGKKSELPPVPSQSAIEKKTEEPRKEEKEVITEEKPEQSTIELGGGDRKEVIEGIR